MANTAFASFTFFLVLKIETGIGMSLTASECQKKKNEFRFENLNWTIFQKYLGNIAGWKYKDIKKKSDST